MFAAGVSAAESRRAAQANRPEELKEGEGKESYVAGSPAPGGGTSTDGLSGYATQSECSEICLLQDSETSPGSPGGDSASRSSGSATKKKVRLLIPDPEVVSTNGSPASLATSKSYTQERVSMLAAPPDMPRPRSYFRQATSVSPVARDKSGHSIYVATRANKNIIHKSSWSRFTYAVVLLNIVLWVPLWLKLATVQRRDARERFESVYNESVRLRLEVSTFDDPEKTECQLCDERTEDDGTSLLFQQQRRLQQANGYRDDDTFYYGVTYPIKAHIENYHSTFEVGTSSYVVLYGSHDFKHWELYNQVGVMTGLKTGDQMVEVCLEKGYTPTLDDDEDDDDEDDRIRGKQTTFKNQFKDTFEFRTGDDDGDVVTYAQNLDISEWVTEWTTLAPTTPDQLRTPAPTPTDLGDEWLSRCCLGNPGFTYLVACATPFEDLALLDEMYHLVRDPPFEDRCVALHGRCGSACGVTAQAPAENTCDELGNIPLKKLLSPEILGKGERSYKHRWYDRRHDIRAIRSVVYHTLFCVFVTMMCIGTWISFLPGVGKSKNSPKPSMTEIEEFFAANDSDAAPLCLVCFAISASEPRMMVLRNMCGKLMSWVNQRKFSLMPRAPPQSIYTSEVTNLSTMFGDDESPNYRNRQSFVTTKTGVEYNDIAELLDIFQDEGHRVGAYALWDAFVDVVHDSDLKFIELMAKKMTHMSADEDKLTSKKNGDGCLLDQELREYTKKPLACINDEDIEKLELAFATFDLLTQLGHHAFWRSDRNVSVVGFRELASDPAAVKVLKQWAEAYKKGRKQGRDPFDSDVVPSEDPAISQDIWQSWWELYSELGGSIQWMKRFDCTKFRMARLHYYRDCDENRNCFRDLMMCYSARANPEDLKVQLAPTRNIRGIKPGVFVRLKEAADDSTGDRYALLGLKQLQRSEARRCHARVVRIFRGKRKHDHRKVRYVKLRECTPELLKAIPKSWLACDGRMPEIAEWDEDDDDDEDEGLPPSRYDARRKRDIEGANRGLKGYRPPVGAGAYENEEAIVPYEVLQPLRESRGKAGGMNHAMEIINHYLRHHSSTFELIKHRRKGAMPPGRVYNRNKVDAHLLFAIMDCRHMGQKGFWDAVIPYFYTYKHIKNPWGRQLEIDSSVAFVQLPQTFTALSLEADIFDMRNEYAFRLANNLRNGVGAITSCGTNAVWNYDIRYQENPLEHRFNEDTMIEDTASSHDVIIEGRKGVYHFQRLVLGARKGTTDYLAAVFRWSRGAVQLAWTTFYFPRSGYVWPWLSILVHVAPIVGTVVWLQMQKLDECHQTPLAARWGILPCRVGPVIGIAADPVFVFYFIWMTSLCILSYWWSRLPALIVMFENITYFFNSISAFFWLMLPAYMCIARNGLPPILDTQVVTVGGLWFQIANSLLIGHIRDWSPLENGKPPSNQSLLRAQQMFFVNAPLHILAMFFGMRDGFAIIFLGKDASRWASFDNKMAIIAVKMWALAMICSLLCSIGIGIWNMVENDETAEEQGARLIGISMSFIILYLIETPVRAMFFFSRVVRQKEKESWSDKFTKAVFGEKSIISPDVFYLLLWTTLIFISFQEKKLGKSTSVLNVARRCKVDPSLEGCPRDDTQYIIRRSEPLRDNIEN
mmetsp:Transcript_8245/g.25499  ORF Transcript_8245/g.25499 Transcript_8245/m.25499 type:complete len:1624 (-) Transcript_8245:637-5508(-)